MEYSVWPTLGYLQEMERIFGKYPRYVIGLSSFGPDQLVPNYDMVAACKAAMETIFRYLAYRLVDTDVRINVVRAVYVRTEALDSTLGADFADFMNRTIPELIVPAESVADAVLALCSGLMDGVTGQVLMIDQGANFANSLMGLFERYQREKGVAGDAP
jgi:enoyl-[acyl-carrier-protein] reductase (NADH)